MAKRRTPHEAAKVRGFFRLNILEDGPNGIPRIVGDSGWVENTITNGGFQFGLVNCVAGIAGSSQISHAALGTGTAPAVTDTTLNGEITDVAGARMAVSPSNVSSKTAQFAFTLNSGVYTTTKTIQNVGLFQSSLTGGGTLYAGNTYATTQLQSNQSVAGSYQIRLS